MYYYIDGDDIGLKIEKAFMENDENTLMMINKKVNETIKAITDYLISYNACIIFSGADGIICKTHNLNPDLLLKFANSLNNEIFFSIGSGENLMKCFLALRYAKSSGKCKITSFENQMKSLKK